MAFGGLIITNLGKNVLAKAQLGNKLEFTHVLIGDGKYTGSYREITSLKNQLFKIPVSNVKVDGNSCVIEIDISNLELEEGYYLREIGILVKQNNKDTLYVYDNAGDDAEFISKGGEAATIEKRLRFQLQISNAEEIILKMQSVLYATQVDFEELVQKVETTFSGNAQILRNTNKNTSLSTTGMWENAIWRAGGSGSGTRTRTVITDAVNPDIKYGWRLERKDGAGALTVTQASIPLISKEEYTISAYARKVSGEPLLLLEYGTNVSDAMELTSEWKLYSFTFKANNIGDIHFGIFTDTVGVIEICGEKLEVGNKATGYLASQYDLPTVTTTQNGVMTAEDKVKLNGIATGANNYVHPDSGATAGTYQRVTVNTQGHVTGGNNNTITIAEGGTDSTTAQEARDKLGVTEELKNLLPGGTQILRNTNAEIKEYPTTNAQGLWKDGGWMRSGGGTVETIAIIDAPNPDIKWGRRVTSINITQDCVYRQRDLSTYPGQEYTFSAYARHISGDNTIKLQHPANGAALRVRFKAIEEWTRYEVTFTAVSELVGIEYGMDSTAIGVVEFCGEKLEAGNKATDWSLSPWDVEQAIASPTNMQITGQLHLSNITDIAGTNPSESALVIGNKIGSHIAFDDNEIMAKSNATTPNRLVLNHDGGEVHIGKDGLRLDGNLKMLNTTKTRLNTVLDLKTGDPNGDGLLIGTGGLMIIGGGESSATFFNLGTELPTSEQLYLTSDEGVFLVSNCQNINNRKTVLLSQAGDLSPLRNGEISLGRVDCKFGEVHANNFRGNADSATKLEKPITINGVALDGTANINVPLTNASTIGISSAFTRNSRFTASNLAVFATGRVVNFNATISSSTTGTLSNILLYSITNADYLPETTANIIGINQSTGATYLLNVDPILERIRFASLNMNSTYAANQTITITGSWVTKPFPMTSSITA